MGEDFLVGKTIRGIFLAANRQAVLFTCDDGAHVALTDAECCSTTWIESIDANVLRFPCTVLSVAALEMPEPREDEEYECLRFYGLRLTTDAGAIDIEYRNESNGYYGGDLVWPGASIYGEVICQHLGSTDWPPVSTSQGAD